MHAMSQNLESEPASLSTAHRVLLADSDPIYLRGLRASLAGGFVFNRPPRCRPCLLNAHATKNRVRCVKNRDLAL